MPKPKQKSYAHETRIAKTFSTWAGKKFTRCPASGALRWGDGHWTYGDLVPPDGLPIVIECKHHKDISIDGLLHQDNKLVDWYRQVYDDSERASDELYLMTLPLVVFRRNGVADRVLISHEDFIDLVGSVSRFGINHPIRYFTTVGIGYTPLVICELDQFLGEIKVQQVEEFLTQ